MTGGREWIVDADGCAAERLSDLACMRSLCDAVVDDLDLRIVGVPQWHRFPAPHGVTGLYLLSESHLSCHTFPESRLATFNLFCCRPLAEWRWEEQLLRQLHADQVHVRVLERFARPEFHPKQLATGGSREKS